MTFYQALLFYYSKRQRTTSLDKQNTSEFELGTFKPEIDDIEKADLNGINCIPPTDDNITDPTALTCKN